MKTLIALALAALLGAASTYFIYGERPAISAERPVAEELTPRPPQPRIRSLIEERLLAPLREPKPLRSRLMFATRTAPIIPLLELPLDAEITAIDGASDPASATMLVSTRDRRYQWRRELRVDLAGESVAVVEGQELLPAADWLLRLRLSENPPAIKVNRSAVIMDPPGKR